MPPAENFMASAGSAHEGIELDLGRYEVRRHGRPIKLERKAMELLILLVRRRDQLVTRKEIIAKLWRSDLFINPEPNINNLVRKVRAGLRDNGKTPRWIETVIGKGYRFVGVVRVIEPHGAPTPAGAVPAVLGRTEAWSERPSVAVVPLFSDARDAEEQALCLGLSDAVVARLGTLQDVDVLPTSAVLNVSGEAAPWELATRLGVRFVVQGGIRASKGQARLAVQMYDASQDRTCFSRKCDFERDRVLEVAEEIAREVAGVLKRPLRASTPRPRYSRDPVAYAEFMNGYRLSASGDPGRLDRASEHLANALNRDPAFALAHATLSFVCATRHFQYDPARMWLEKAEFHCRRALELDPNLAEAHVSNAFLLWGPSKNFQHLEAIAELRTALALQKNLPHAYNRLGTILAHIGLLDAARDMYERGRPFNPGRRVSHSIVQVYVWGGEYERAREEIQAWGAENPTNTYAIYFALQVALLTEEWQEARALLDDALRSLPEEPLIVSLEGLYYALRGDADKAQGCLGRACGSPKSFGHAHHTYYQIACILAVLGQNKAAFEWLERSVDTGFACWPFFQHDPSLRQVRELPEFEMLISSLQAKYSAMTVQV